MNCPNCRANLQVVTAAMESQSRQVNFCPHCGQPQAQPRRGDQSERERIQELLAAKNRRKHELELKNATYGISGDPRITIEIEDLENEITNLNRQLAALSS